MVKNLPANAGDVGSIPDAGRFSGDVKPLQYFCLGNSMHRGAWWAIYSRWGRQESDTTKLSDWVRSADRRCSVTCKLPIVLKGLSSCYWISLTEIFQFILQRCEECFYTVKI